MRCQKATARLHSSLSTGSSLSRVAGLLVDVDQNFAVARGEEGRGLAQDELDRGALVRVGDHERTLAHLLAHDRERLQQRLVEAGGVNEGHISIRPRAGRRIGVRELELRGVARGSSQSRLRERARARELAQVYLWHRRLVVRWIATLEQRFRDRFVPRVNGVDRKAVQSFESFDPANLLEGVQQRGGDAGLAGAGAKVDEHAARFLQNSVLTGITLLRKPVLLLDLLDRDGEGLESDLAIRKRPLFVLFRLRGARK